MGWIGSILLILGIWLVGRKRRVGFIFGMLGSLTWMSVGFIRGTNDLAFINILMATFNFYGWLNWGKDNQYWRSMVLPEHRVKWWQIWR